MATAFGLLFAAPATQAQSDTTSAPDQSRPVKERPLPDRLPDKPSLPPVFSIPVDALGFAAPGPLYLGQRNSLASLDFLDEDQLLFTFRVPGLMRREAGDNAGEDVRQVRAVVVALPAGNVTAEAVWTLHDRARYLWMLKDGHFLLRDRDSLRQGDASLDLKPILRFPGPLLWLELDPSQQYLVTNSREPVSATARLNDVPSPPAAAAGMTSDAPEPSPPSDVAQPDLVVRILQRISGQVMLVSRTRSAVHLPINSDGYLERLRGNGSEWMLNLNYFTGGSTILGRVESTCSPSLDFISQRELLVSACTSSGGRKLAAITTEGRVLWEDTTSAKGVWPLLTMAPNGLRLARETLAVTHPITAYAPLDQVDVKGQLVRVFNAADGKVALEAPASPALDAGGNVAISPSGRRVAVLNAGAIQVFDLPPPPPLPVAAGAKSGH